MRKPILLGIHGLKTAGKDTTFGFAQEWGDAQGLTAKSRGFADYGKLEFARQYFPDITLDDAVAWCNEFKFTGEIILRYVNEAGRGEQKIYEGREPLACLLTEGGRYLHGEDVWVNLLLPEGDVEGIGYPKWWEEFEYHYAEGPWVADICGVTDVRFENEILRVKHHGGVAVKVKRDSAEQAVIDEAQRKGWERPHDSELGLPDDLFDFVLDNNDSLRHLERQVREMMNTIKPTVTKVLD